MYACTATDTHRNSPLHHFGVTSRQIPVVASDQLTCTKGTEIYREKEPADYIYQVTVGAVRSYKRLSDGRRQIGAFHLIGDIFGLENGNEHRFTAEAIVDTKVRVIKRAGLEDRAVRDPAVAGHLLRMTTDLLQHAEDHLLLLGRKNAVEKVAAFLIEMDTRMTASAAMTLPMSRRDIADYLGLQLETVSRALSQLRAAGVLKFVSNTQREIEIINRKRLAGFNQGTLATALS